MITVKCPQCGGKGHKPISPELHRTLAALSKSRKPLSIPELIVKLHEGCGATAINKRVNSLVALNLVKVRKSKPGVRRFVVNGAH